MNVRSYADAGWSARKHGIFARAFTDLYDDSTEQSYQRKDASYSSDPSEVSTRQLLLSQFWYSEILRML